MLLLNLILLIDVTFSTPTGDYTQNPRGVPKTFRRGCPNSLILQSRSCVFRVFPKDLVWKSDTVPLCVLESGVSRHRIRRAQQL
jgi:hypothetical protein